MLIEVIEVGTYLVFVEEFVVYSVATGQLGSA
jgi:hypothetical protein